AGSAMRGREGAFNHDSLQHDSSQKEKARAGRTFVLPSINSEYQTPLDSTARLFLNFRSWCAASKGVRGAVTCVILDDFSRFGRRG
ncbi:MAG TPA: hypothetical protein VFJ10_07055, partial [Acidobacteriaceae bacterium]|nr:hypothetical protein [Acidobacteriaceae bacterium]